MLNLFHFVFTEKSCGMFPIVSNAQLITQDNLTTLFGQIIQYSCVQEGYRFNATAQLWNMTCDDMKLWTPAPLPCLR